VKPKLSNFAKFLRQVADLVEEFGDDGFEEVVAQLSSIRKNASLRSPRSVTGKNDEYVASLIIRGLENSTSREQGHSFLADVSSSRDQLLAAARLRSIHITKEDNLSRIREKLVESIIGARLSSRAIRGESKID
jgi:hypothetical protein